MTVLVTGATGFVGLNLTKTLLDRNQNVVSFASAEPTPGLSAGLFVQGDIRSAEDLDRAFATAPIDRVIHAAAITPDRTAEAEQAMVIVDVNVGGAVQLMQAARRAGARRVLSLSSVAVYGYATGSPDGRLHEDAPCQPTALYGTTKWAAERIVHRLGALYGIETTTVRLGACFGIGEHATGVRPMLSPHWQCAEAARAGRDCVLARPMNADWVDVAEAAAAIVDLLDMPTLEAGPFNIGGGAVTSVASWCEALATIHADFRWWIDPAAATIRYGMERDRVPMDMSRLRAAIGTAPWTDALSTRARRYLDWRNSPAGLTLCGP